MPRFIKTLLMVALMGLGSCSRHDLDGQNVGNGGDPLAKLFIVARAHSLRILESVRTIRPAGPSAAAVKTWYEANRGELLKDVESTPEYTWVRANPNSACGFTGNARNAAVFLAYERCGRISTVRDAALHLIGESVHHFQIRDDSFTAAVAVAVAERWDQIIGALPGAIQKRMGFEQGRIHAAEVMLRIKPQNIPSFLRGLHTEEQTSWLYAARETLSADLLASRHVWVDGNLSPGSDPEEKCLATPALTAADDELSYSGCELKVATRERAGQLVLSAAIFHLRGNRAEAQRLASLAYAAWFNMGHPEKAHWLTLPPHSPDQRDVYEVVWSPYGLLAWSQTLARVLVYDPRTNVWKFTNSDSRKVDHLRKGENFEFVGDRMVNFGDCYASPGKTGSGMMFDLIANEWIPMTRHGAPLERWFGTARTVVKGDELFVIGGARNCVGSEHTDGQPTNDFARFNSRKNTWFTKPVEAGSPLARTGQTVANLGNRLFVWGGRSFDGKDFVTHDDGALFDFEGHALQSLPSENAPKGRLWAQSVFGENYLVLLGGYSEGDRLGLPYKRTLVSDGAVYHVDTNRWVKINPDGAPELSADRGFRLIWIGNEVLYVGHVIAYFNPVTNTWRQTDRVFAPLLENPFKQTPKVFWTGVEALVWDVWGFGNKLSGYAYFP